MGQVEGASWGVLRVGARVQLERLNLVHTVVSFCVLLIDLGNIW